MIQKVYDKLTKQLTGLEEGSKEHMDIIEILSDNNFKFKNAPRVSVDKCSVYDINNEPVYNKLINRLEKFSKKLKKNIRSESGIIEDETDVIGDVKVGYYLYKHEMDLTTRVNLYQELMNVFYLYENHNDGLNLNVHIDDDHIVIGLV